MPAEHDEPLDPQLATAVAALRNAPPGADLWPAIARRLEPRRPRGTIVLPWPAALAAALVLAALGAGGVLLVRRAPVPASSSGPQTIAAAPGGMAPAIAAGYSAADTTLLKAIGDLERAVRANVTQLDPGAQTALQQSLALVDQAIAQARTEHRAAPDDPAAARYVTTMLRKKLDVLQTISRLTANRS